jgi:GNAT superfamily N-acetyltransferase
LPSELGTPLVLREVVSGRAAASARRILGLTGPEGRAGRLFVFTDLAADPRDPPAAAALTRPLSDGSVELERFGVSPRMPQVAIARRLLASLADLLRGEGCRRLVAGADDTDVHRRGVLQAAGFRPCSAPPPSRLSPWLELVL